MRTLIAKNLKLTGNNIVPDSVSLEGNPNLHKETLKGAGKVLQEKYYKEHDSEAGTFSNLVAEKNYAYNGNNKLSVVTRLYADDGSIAIEDTTEWKTDSDNPNKLYEIKTRNLNP